MPPRGPIRRRPRHRRPPGTLRVEPLADRTVPSASLLLATAGDVSNSGAPGTRSWTGGTALEFGSPNFALGPGATDGTFSALFNINRFGSGDIDLDSLHYVRTPIAVGGGANTFALRPGDLLVSIDQDGKTLSSLNQLTVGRDDVFVFRPRTAGDYSAGTFYPLLDHLRAVTGVDDVRAVALVEADTVVGELTLPAGSFLFVQPGGATDNDVRLFVPTGVGVGQTAGSVSVLIAGDDLGIGPKVVAVELVDAPTAVAGQTLPAGTLLLALDATDPKVGTNAIAATRFDVLSLTVTQTTLGSGQAVADAAVMFRGSDVGLDTSAEALRGVTLIPVSPPPFAINDQYGVLEDQALSVASPGVLANDTDADGDPLTTALRTLPAHGTVSLSADGSFTYAPAANYYGTDSFTYTVRDDTGGSAVGTVTIDITPVNDPPSFTIPGNPPAVNEDAGPQTVVNFVTDISTGPGPGSGPRQTVTFLIAGNTNPGLFSAGPAVSGNGTLTYTPAANAFGTATLTVVAHDDGGTANGGIDTSAPQAFVVTVRPVSEPPTARGDVATTAGNTPVTIAVLANDTDPDGNRLTVVSVTPAGRGTVTTDGTTVTYNPAAGFAGTDTFRYTVSDGTGRISTATVAVTVTPVNRPPVTADDAFVVGMDQVLIVPLPGVSANDTDPDGDSLTVVVVTGPANGQLLYSPGGGFLYQPAAGFVGTDTFTYVATDSAGGSSGPAVVTITVLPPTAPITAGDDAYTTPEDTPLLAGPVLVNDADPDGDPVTAVLATGPAHGTLELDPDGTFLYVPDPGFAGTDSFTYVAQDSAGARSSPASVTVTVVPVNDRPVAAADRFTTRQDTTLRVRAPGVLGNDADPDGNRLTAVLVTGPAHGTLAFRPDGSFRYTPDAGFSGRDSFTYRATDGTLASKSVKVSIRVEPARQRDPGPPPVVPPPSGGPGPVVKPGSGEPPSSGGSPTPTGPILPVPVAITGLSAFGPAGLPGYVVAPAAPAGPPPVAPPPSVVVPPLPPPPTIPILPPPIRVDTRPSPAAVNPPAVVPDTPAAPAVPVIPADDPVFSGLDDLKKDLGQQPGVQTVTGSVVGTGVVATAGYVLLSPRLAYWLLSALLARRTVWKPFDPLEVVYAWEKENGTGDDDSLQGMVDAGSDGPAPEHGTAKG